MPRRTLALIGVELVKGPDKGLRTDRAHGRGRGRRARDESRLGGHTSRAREDLAAVPLDVVESGQRLPALWFVERLRKKVENEHLGGMAAPNEPG